MIAIIVIYFSSFIGYFLLMHCEKLVIKRINDFYVIVYAPFRTICLKARPSLRRQRLSRDELDSRLRRDTIRLFKSIPSGVYYATTHGQIIEALRHMQTQGRASIIFCKKKGRLLKRKNISNVISEAFYNITLPQTQMYKIKFRIL